MDVKQVSISVKGQAGNAVELQYTRHGPILLTDNVRHLAFVLRWTGSEPGTAPYLGGIALDRASDCKNFREALSAFKQAGENFICADVDGNILFQAAALTPIRKNWTGLLPVPGWTGEYEWSGFFGLDDLPHDFSSPNHYFATANNDT
jgi:penicillin amidase